MAKAATFTAQYQTADGKWHKLGTYPDQYLAEQAATARCFYWRVLRGRKVLCGRERG